MQKKILACLLTCALLLPLCVCLPHFGRLSAKLENQIRQDRLAYLVNEEKRINANVNIINIDEYCGTYSGAVAVMIYDSFYTHSFQGETVADVIFHCRDGNTMTVWKSGKFYTLQTAYDEGLLSKRDLKKIAKIHNQWYEPYTDR